MLKKNSKNLFCDKKKTQTRYLVSKVKPVCSNKVENLDFNENKNVV